MYPYIPTVRELFLIFMQIGVSSFGGAMPWARYYLVEKRGWLTEAQFTDILTIGATAPGPNIVNIAVYYGFKCRGLMGAAAAFVGLLILPFFITVGLSIGVGQALSSPQVKSALMGLTCAAVGFMFSTALKLMKPFGRNSLALATCVGTAMLGIVFRLPLPVILLVVGAIALWLAHRGTI